MVSGFQWILTGGVLAACSYSDIRRKKVSNRILLLYFILALAGQFFCLIRTQNWLQLVSGIIPGVICMILSGITAEGFGYGDSLFVLICGISLGWKLCTIILAAAFLLSGFWAMGLFIAHRSGKLSFPFIPFLALAYIGVILFF